MEINPEEALKNLYVNQAMGKINDDDEKKGNKKERTQEVKFELKNEQNKKVVKKEQEVNVEEHIQVKEDPSKPSKPFGMV